MHAVLVLEYQTTSRRRGPTKSRREIVLERRPVVPTLFIWLAGLFDQGEGTPIYKGKVVAERTSEVVAERSVCCR